MVTIKGLRDGLLINFGEDLWLSQLRELESKLQSNPRFFRGGQVTLNVHRLSLSSDDIRRAQALLNSHGVTLQAVLAQDIHTATNVIELGLLTRLSETESLRDRPVPGRPAKDAPASPDSARRVLGQSQTRSTSNSVASSSVGADAGIAQEATRVIGQVEGSDGLLVRRRVRSGQILRHPGHIVVLGDVNPGSQLIAGGDIIVWGKLQGSVHAGALGDAGATICALEFAPTLIRIADAMRASRPGEKRKKPARPEMALIEDQEIMIVSWQAK
ncbi:MAG: septum site-determining protein MinC [Candidatus Roseilinea sp.]|uniref:septum site-determining protein MinC n=1 Tax=Candidatus Roseilinea sp. TaxID=2838777 RepID=UPI00404B512B